MRGDAKGLGGTSGLSVGAESDGSDGYAEGVGNARAGTASADIGGSGEGAQVGGSGVAATVKAAGAAGKSSKAAKGPDRREASEAAKHPDHREASEASKGPDRREPSEAAKGPDRRELKIAVDSMMAENPHRIVVSNRRSAGSEYRKIVVSPKAIGGVLKYQAEKFTETQAFHENLSREEAAEYIVTLLEKDFKQANAFSSVSESEIKISKKGKILTGKKRGAGKIGAGKAGPARNDADKAGLESPKDIRDTRRKKLPQKLSKDGNEKTAAPILSFGVEYRGELPEEGNGAENGFESLQSHDRKKKRLIEEGTAVAPLIDMGIFTKEGKLVKSMSDKFRQINRFLEIVDDAVDACGFQEVRIVDFGCGKAYLTFILYYYLNYIKKIPAYMTGLDLKADVIRKCSEAARKYGYENLKFQVGDISMYESDEPVDMVITLHACDTATDYALAHAVAWNSRVILSVPCCQHEVNATIHKGGDFDVLLRHGLLQERFSALLTDSIRAAVLEDMGYTVDVIEFIDFAHSPKNLMLRCVKDRRAGERNLSAAWELAEKYGFRQALLELAEKKCHSAQNTAF